MIIGAIYAFIGAAAAAFSPYWLGMAIDSLTEGVDPTQLAIYAAGLIVLAVIVAFFRYLLRMLTGRIAAGITYRMSQDLFQRLLLFDQKTRQDYGTGDLLSRGTSDFIYIWRFYSAGFQMSMHALFLLLIGCALMALSSPLLAGIVMVTLICGHRLPVEAGVDVGALLCQGAGGDGQAFRLCTGASERGAGAHRLSPGAGRQPRLPAGQPGLRGSQPQVCAAIGGHLAACRRWPCGWRPRWSSWWAA